MERFVVCGWMDGWIQSKSVQGVMIRWWTADGECVWVRVQVLCWKEMRFSGPADRKIKYGEQEVRLMTELRGHPNVVKLYGSFQEKNHSPHPSTARGNTAKRWTHKMVMITEFCDGGDLRKWVDHHLSRKYGPPLFLASLPSFFSSAPCLTNAVLFAHTHTHTHTNLNPSTYVDERKIWRVMAHMAAALHTMHCRPEGSALHCDIKPENIFVCADGICKLGDFGLSTTLSLHKPYAKGAAGTPYYMSPVCVHCCSLAHYSPDNSNTNNNNPIGLPTRSRILKRPHPHPEPAGEAQQRAL